MEPTDNDFLKTVFLRKEILCKQMFLFSSRITDYIIAKLKDHDPKRSEFDIFTSNFTLPVSIAGCDFRLGGLRIIGNEHFKTLILLNHYTALKNIPFLLLDITYQTKFLEFFINTIEPNMKNILC